MKESKVMKSAEKPIIFSEIIYHYKIYTSELESKLSLVNSSHFHF